MAVIFSGRAQNSFNVNDYADLVRYDSANLKLKESDTRPKVVFMGNSITEGWVNMRPTFFTNRDFVGRGIGGQVSHQMLLRFQADVIQLKPQIAVILAGTNDLAQNSGFVTLDQIMDNIQAMATLAKSNDIKVLLCSVLPAVDFPWFPIEEPTKMITELNNRIKQYADTNDIGYVDYYSALVDDMGGLKVPEYTTADDLVHPNEAGYVVMEEVVLRALKPLLD